MAARVYTTQERQFDDLEHVAIAVTLVRERPGQQHIGVLHKNDFNKEVRMLHLAWHNDLKEGVPKSSYAWIALPILSRRARQVAAFCRKVYRSNQSGIPYAFSSASDCFDKESGAFMLGPKRYGLTCASFVLGIFHSVGLPLIEYDTWPADRLGDREWQQFIIEALKSAKASGEHIQNVESEVGTVRYRPEDVAGACAADSIPAPFEIADELAQEILAKLKENNLYT